jgi:hypothetical protein
VLHRVCLETTRLVAGSVSGQSLRRLASHGAFEQQDMWFRLMDFVMFPTETLSSQNGQHSVCPVPAV